MSHRPLPSSSVERYSRQLLLSSFGVSSQQNLSTSRILIVGLGGLGCPALLYLAGAGVGVLGLVDRPNERVERSNLHRQIAHSESTVGVTKLNSAAKAARDRNSDVQLELHESFENTNAEDIVSKYNVVLDCTDNVATRYLVSDACASMNVPLVAGAAIGMEGQLTVYCSGDDIPCYRCIFPTPPPPSCVGSCDADGVLGPVPGTIGTLQALEAIKLVSKMGMTSTLGKRMLLFDGADMTFRNVKLRPKRSCCVACGKNRKVIIKQFDYKAFAAGLCEEDGQKIQEKEKPAVKQTVDPSFRISATDFAEMRKKKQPYRLIDVRAATQFAMCHIEEAQSYPLADLKSHIDDLCNEPDVHCTTIFICRRGNASQKALRMSLDHGLSNVYDVIGGLQAWHYDVDQEFPLY